MCPYVLCLLGKGWVEAALVIILGADGTVQQHTSGAVTHMARLHLGFAD